MTDKVTPQDVMPENDIKLELTNQGLTLEKYVKSLKSELSAMEVKAQIPKGEKEFSYSKRMKAWQIRQNARRDLGQLYGAEAATEGKQNVTVIVKKFSQSDENEE